LTTGTARVPGRPILGPEDRETFFAAQARHRRASWKLMAVCTLAVILMGIPIAMVVSPLVLGAATLVSDLINLFTPAPNVVAGIGQLADWLSGPTDYPIFYAIIALPGVVLVLLGWAAVRRLLLRGGVGGVLLGLGARDPRADDLEEQQLANVLGEMAVAAGVPPPKLRLLDGPGVSAAAVGTGLDDAAVVVSRGMLDQLDRDETQAIIGHLVASTGNGDLAIAHRIVSVHATLGLIEALTYVAVSPEVRARLRVIFRAARRRDRLEAQESERLSLDLLNGLVQEAAGDPFESDGARTRKSGPPRARHHHGEQTLRERIKTVLTYPFMLTWMLLWMCRTAFLSLLTDPLTSLLWRRRRFLADASAVQLTRFPSGLAFALRRLAEIEAPLPGGPWASFLFAAGPRRGIGGSPIAGFGRETALVGIDCLPDPYTRIERLRRMGADVPRPGPNRSGPVTIFLKIWNVFYPILLVAVWVISFGLLVMATMLGFFMIPMCLIPIVGIPHLLLRDLIPWLLHR
jgi:Zn-dependent protease with chaperone function